MGREALSKLYWVDLFNVCLLGRTVQGHSSAQTKAGEGQKDLINQMATANLSVISVLGRPRQEDPEFKASLNYIPKLSPKLQQK